MINLKIVSMVIIGIVGLLLTIIRRYKNTDNAAGIAVAGWTLFSLFMIAISM